MHCTNISSIGIEKPNDLVGYWLISHGALGVVA
jgi:hypothetical protein